jgi:hypothetical protein
MGVAIITSFGPPVSMHDSLSDLALQELRAMQWRTATNRHKTSKKPA